MSTFKQPSQGEVARQCEAVIGTAFLSFESESPFWALDLYGGWQ